MVFRVLQDATGLQLNYLTLLTNQTEANVWIDRVLASVMEMAMKVAEVFVYQSLTETVIFTTSHLGCYLKSLSSVIHSPVFQVFFSSNKNIKYFRLAKMNWNKDFLTTWKTLWQQTLICLCLFCFRACRLNLQLVRISWAPSTGCWTLRA